MIESTFSPTVLLFDDDPAVLGLLRRRIHHNTSLGVVVADNMREAKRLVDEKRVKFNAVIADLSIVPDRQDPIHSLHDGVDFLCYLAEHRPDVSQYVLSVWSERRKYRERSREAKLCVRTWFQKLNFGTDDADRTAPWNYIEREMYEVRLKQKVASETDAPKDASNFSERVRQTLRPIIRTYLQELPDPYLVHSPIEVICRRDEGFWLADALQLGLLQAGVGDSIEDSLEDLGAKIVEQYVEFQGADPAHVEGYAEKAFMTMKSYIDIKAA